ncbi:MAG: RluA family pseudouridine synthase [Lachnospiraceae bacterium]|nr:RluA family pseudouridine synthase [Lachnospiraceae bacterium]
MKRTLCYDITEETSGQTILQFLKNKGYSSSNVVALKKIEKSVLVNGTWEHVTYKLYPGDVLTIHYSEDTASKNIVATPLPLDIVYEDEDIIVVNKPSNMPVHPSMNNYTNTLANALMHYYGQKGEPFTFRCINRLDRDTTGLVLLAKHGISAGILSLQMQNREIHRTYLALAEGAFEHTSGTIDAPIARKDESIIEREVNFETGESAITHYKVIKTSSQYPYTLLSLHLETGRTHQIRVHMQYIAHPLIGDTLYPSDCTHITRQALHSSRLSFRHPITGIEMCFEAELPKDMSRLL